MLPSLLHLFLHRDKVYAGSSWRDLRWEGWASASTNTCPGPASASTSGGLGDGVTFGVSPSASDFVLAYACVTSLCSACFFRWRNHHPRPSKKAKAAIPPMTPPTIAPTGVLEEEVDSDGDELSEAEEDGSGALRGNRFAPFLQQSFF